MILSHIAKVFEDEQVLFVELLYGTFQRQSLPSLLQTLHKIGGSGEQDPVAVLYERMTEGGAEVRLSLSAVAEQQDHATSVYPSVAVASATTCAPRASAQRQNRAVERLAGRQAGLYQVSLDASLIPFGEFQLCEGRQQSRRGPTFAVGALCEALPHRGDGRQPQFTQQQRNRALSTLIVSLALSFMLRHPSKEKHILTGDRCKIDRDVWHRGRTVRTAPAAPQHL